jgi:hypothetical protein
MQTLLTPPCALVQLPHQPSGYSCDACYPNICPCAATFDAVATYTNHIAVLALGGVNNNNNNIRPGQQEDANKNRATAAANMEKVATPLHSPLATHTHTQV